MTADLRLRSVAEGDLDRLIALNNAAVPAVNTLDRAAMARFAAIAPHFRVALQAGTPAGLMVALGPGIAYDSLNYRWFEAHYEAFLYVDRIVVDPTARSAGIGTLLYEDLVAVANAMGVRRLACEVNLRPPNERSIRFHERLGFRGVATQETENGAKTVQLMIRELVG